MEQLARLAYSIDAARHARLLSLRGLAEAAGVPLASVEGCLRGRGWPQFRTLGRMAAVLGLRLVVEPDQQRRLRVPLVSMARHRPGPDRAALERAAGDDQLALAAAWHNIAVGQLRWYVAAAGLTGKDVARLLRVRQATWSQARPEAPRRWVSLPVMSAVADLVGQRLVADARDRAWPWADWKGTQ